MYGQDKTSLDKLKNTVKDLESLKIEILPKSNKTIDLKNSIEKIKSQIINVDEELSRDLLNIMENSENEIADKNGSEIKISNNSNLNNLFSNIDALTNDVNNAVKNEIERKAEEAKKKAEEEQKAKEEAEKKALEESLANVINGDFTYFAGDYTEIGTSSKLTLDKNGKVTINGSVFTSKPISIKKESNGSYWCLVHRGELADDGFTIYPVGIAGGGGNTNKARIEVTESMGASIFQKN